ncbi:hypothetical protein CesoFtcFv8_016562 [Champsocephalus esox]|uniref:Uncharacterized protein n=1 Tax=Champsocephalus esox TaxID=159716 RepID=A0AAN8GQE9_9TELE|nr:hypothetical protein CesoFtcFv8_016562 [Champsocephalus esox]
MEACQQGETLLIRDIFRPEPCSVQRPPHGSAPSWSPYEALLPPVHPPLVPNTCTLLTDTVSHFRGQSLTLPTCRGTPKPLPVLLEAFNFKRK